MEWLRGGCVSKKCSGLSQCYELGHTVTKPPWNNARVVFFSLTHTPPSQSYSFFSFSVTPYLCLFFVNCTRLIQCTETCVYPQKSRFHSPWASKGVCFLYCSSIKTCMARIFSTDKHSLFQYLTLSLSSLLSLPKMQIMQESNKSCMLALL